MSKKNSEQQTSAPRTKDHSSTDFERDLSLKLKMRQLFWTMGASTCIDVKLRAYVSGVKTGPGWQEFTDLDVLSVSCSVGGQPQITLADCSTSSRGAIERMFWIRGVAEFFDADNAFLVRSRPVPAATRALSTRIGVGVLDPQDYVALLRTFKTPLDFAGPLACLFDENSVQMQLGYTGELDRRLSSLINFVRYDYWVYDPYRNLTQVVAHIAKVVKSLDSRNPYHLGLFFECAWLYSVSLIQAIHHVRSSRMSDIPSAVHTYVAGGELAMREKQALAGLLERTGVRVDTRSAVLPPYADNLAELVTRLLVQPAELSDILRYAEYLITATIIGESATVGMAFGEVHVRPIAAKLLADVCGFLVTASGARPEFRTAARERLVHDLTGGEPQTGKRQTASAHEEASMKELVPSELPFEGDTTVEP